MKLNYIKSWKLNYSAQERMVNGGENKGWRSSLEAAVYLIKSWLMNINKSSKGFIFCTLISPFLMNFNTWISNKIHKRILINSSDFKLFFNSIKLLCPEKSPVPRPFDLFLISYPRFSHRGRSCGEWEELAKTLGQMMNKFFGFFHYFIIAFSFIVA